jgi:type IV pilus assembly protein PilQ
MPQPSRACAYSGRKVHGTGDIERPVLAPFPDGAGKAPQTSAEISAKGRPMTTLKNVQRVQRSVASLAVVLFTISGTSTTLAQTRIQTMGMVQDAQPVKTAPAARTASGEPKENSRVKVDDNMLVDLHVSDEDLSTVLEMLSIQSQKNIIASSNVSAKITANLYGATFEEALDSVLHVNGFGYVVQGNFVYVYTSEEMKAIEASQRQRVSKVLRLGYLNAVDAAAFVTPLLSEGGQIKTPNRTTQFSISDTPIGSDEYVNDAMLVVFDYEENVTEIESLLKQIDTKPAQVLVEATVLQTQLTEANAFGVDFSLLADLDFKDFVGVGGPTQAVNALIGGRATSGGSNALPSDGEARAITSNVGNTASSGGLKIGVVDNDVAVFMRVLDEVTDSTILSNPKILTLNRMASRVLVGRKVGYLSTTSTDTSTTQSVQFLDTGTQLDFRPFVTNDGFVRMELKPKVSEAVIRDVKDATGAAVTVPDEITNELVTNVMVRDGQTIVLGGLFRESTQSSRRQIPILGDIPIFGSAFRGHDDTVNRNEIIFLITPTIVNDTALAEMGQRGLEHTENVRAGARQGLLPFSRDKMSSVLNLRAERLADQGDKEGAMWNLNTSLHINPSQPEAIDMRNKLSGETKHWPTRNNLDRIIGQEVRKMAPKKAEAPNLNPESSSLTSANASFTSRENVTDSNTTQDNTAPSTTTTPAITSADATPAEPVSAAPTTTTNSSSLVALSPDNSFNSNSSIPVASNVDTTVDLFAGLDRSVWDTTTEYNSAQNGVAQVTPTTENETNNTNHGAKWLGRGGLAGSLWFTVRGASNGLPQFSNAPTEQPADGQ